jgi:hypothetical protein
VKLRGRPDAKAAHERDGELCSVGTRPDWSRGAQTLFPRARGDTTVVHGPLQRLLGGIIRRGVVTATGGL